MDKDKKYWLALSSFSGIGPLRFKSLFNYFGSAKRAWNANESELIKSGLGKKLTDQFLSFRNKFAIDLCLSALDKKGIGLMTLLDKNYPRLLKEINDPPFVLYYLGDIGTINEFDKCIAVVGTRKMTSYGKEAAERVVSGLTNAGYTIVSGMAYGIDAVAHRIAIKTDGKTIAVFGGGVDHVYPVSNTTLYFQIVKKGGLVLSEYPPGFRPSKNTFPQRNRIISGLSLGVVVIEGAKRSGTLITARHAAEQGRDVFAVPGPITSRNSSATSYLIKQGAKLVEKAEDILEEIDVNTKYQKTDISSGKLRAGKNTDKDSNSQLSKEEKIILNLLEKENLHFDDIVRRSGIEAKKLGGILGFMEVNGLVRSLDQGIYGI